MSAATRAGPNPFVGPRPFEFGERLYGRDRELTELYYRLSAERIVVLHSPSGAGKSSLVQAGLVPRLRRRFYVWPPTRVNQQPPAGIDANRYVLSALQGFEEGIPEPLRRAAPELAELTFARYLEERPRRPGAPENVILIFDQFEEVLTVDLLNSAAKTAFFDQLGEVLRDPRVWALFVLREDHLAPLDPYAYRVPTHLRNRFRIDLLGLDAARDAMVKPARSGGRAFPAADLLLHDLATMNVQQPDGSFKEETGKYVEPVQLQVVCRKLWEDMDGDDLSIDREDVERFGNVSEALGKYYAAVVDKVADNVQQARAVREWFEKKLITSGGIRSQVLREEKASGGLDNALVEALRGNHLIRPEQRAGATWYELAHDRLVEPVRKDNRAWFDEHLSVVQRRASLWDSQKRPSGLLLKGEELLEGERWAAENEALLKDDDVESEFLEQSRAAQRAAERERRQARRIRWLAVATFILVAVAIIVSLFAGWQSRQAAIATRKAKEKTQEANASAAAARAERSKADAAKKTAEAESQRAEEAARKAEEAEQAAERQRQDAEKARADAELQRGLAEQKRREAETAREVAESSAAAARAAEQVAEQRKREAGEAMGALDAETKRRQQLQRRKFSQDLAARSLELRADTAALLALEAYHLYSENQEDQASPWPAVIFDALRQTLAAIRPPAEQTQDGQVRTLAWSSNGQDLFTGNDAGQVFWYRHDSQVREIGRARLESAVRAVAISPIDRLLAVGTAAEGVRLWKLPIVEDVPEGDSEGSDQGLAGVEILIEEEIQDGVAAWKRRRFKTLAFASDRTLIAAYWRCRDERPGLGCADPAVELLVFRSEEGVWRQHETYLPDLVDVFDLAPDPRTPGTIAVAGRSAKKPPENMRWIDVGQVPPQPAPPPATAEAFRARLGEEVRALAYSPDGKFLAFGLASGEIFVWDRDEQRSLAGLGDHRGAAVTALSFSPPASRPAYLSTAGFDGKVRLHAVDKDDPRPEAPVFRPIEIQHRADPDDESWVWAVAFRPAEGTEPSSSPSSGTLEIASAGADRAVRWWNVRTADLRQRICDSVGRDLSREEWETLVKSELTQGLVTHRQRCFPTDTEDNDRGSRR